MTMIGARTPRTDAYAKVTGTAVYVDDVRPEGCWYGATVRSTRPRARVVRVERGAGIDWSDVVLLTSDAIPGENVVALMTDDQPVLAGAEIRHVAEAVALVAAPTREKALEAARHVIVHTEELEPLFDPAESEGHSCHIFGKDNVFSRLELNRYDNELADRLGLRRAGDTSSGPTVHMHEGLYKTGLQEQLYIEPQGMLAIPRSDGGLTLLGSLQCPYYVSKALRRVLGHDRFNVVQAATGGGFGGKEEYPSMIAAHAALLATKIGRPVKMIYRRDEDMRATTKRHPAVVRIRSLTSGLGQLLRWDAEILLDGGAYNTLSPVVLSRAVLHLTGPYRCPDVALRGRVVATNTPPNGAFRGFGAPQACFAVERHLDRIARTIGMDPLELRRKNLLREGDRTVTGQVIRSPSGVSVLDSALRASKKPVPPVPPAPGAGPSDRLRRGRGVALAWHGCGFTGNGEARLKGRVALELRGSDVHLLTGSIDMGQGADTVLPQIVAEELGLPLDRIFVDPHDTAHVPDSGPTVASRTTMVVGSVAQQAARALVHALQAETGLSATGLDQLLAARSSDAPLRVEEEYTGDPNIQWNNETYTGDAYPTYSWAASLVDLDVDMDTGEVLYRRFISATDVGRAINPTLAEGQLQGGALQALGWATFEECVLDDRRAMRNDRMTNYIIPTAADAPPMEALLIESPFAGGPFGAKGIGEIPMDGPAAAVAQAIENATGVVLDELPMSPERVLAGVEARQSRGKKRRGGA